MKWGLILPTKEILRKCLATGERLDKKSLIRIVKTKDGIVIDDSEKGKLNGRGAYLSKNLEAIKKAEEKDLLSRAFKEKVDHEIYDRLKEYIK